MEIASAGNIPAALMQSQAGDAVAVTVLRKALDIQAQNARQLLEALPQPAASNPPNLGNRVDVFA